MQEIAIPIRNEWPDKQTYEEIITKPYRTIIKIGDENLTKTHLHKSKRLLTIECLNDYKNALGKTINLFKDPNTKDTVINYFEQNNCSDTEEAILRKETSNLIRDFSRNIKEMRDISLEKLNKAEEEANNEKIFTRMSKKRDLRKAREAVEKAYKNMKKIKINMKEKGREKGIYSPKTIANFIKKIFNILNKAQELLSTLLEQYEGNSSHLIDGYKDLSTKELKDMKKKLESNNSKESFGWNIENLEKAFKEIDRASSTMQNPKSKKGRKNIRSIIKDANSRIDIFIAETANKYSIEKNLKQFLKNAKNNLMGINEDTDELISRLVLWFPLGVREMARIYLTLLIATKLGPLYDSVREVSISTEKYKNRVSSSIEATSMLSIAGGIATTLGFAGIVGAFLAATIGYAIIGAIRAVNAGSDLDDSERVLEETINWTNPETNPSQSKGKGDFANLPNSITDTQVMVNKLLTDVDLMEAKAEQFKKSGKQIEAEGLLAKADQKRAEAEQLRSQSSPYIKEQIINTMEKIEELYEKSRETITELYNFKFDEKQDAMEQIESFVKMMKEEADTSKDICIEIKAAENVINQAKKVGVYTEELEKAVTSLKKAQKEVSAKATEVKESLPETIKKMIVGKYSKMYDERNAIAKKLSESMASIGEYSNKLNELEDLDKLSTLGNYEHSLVRLEKISNLEIDRTLYETENYISRAIKMNEQLAPITTITDNLVEIGIFKKISDIYETYDLSNLPDEASKKIDEVKETMVKKVSGTTAILKDSNENLQRNLIPSLNDMKKTFEQDPFYSELKPFWEIEPKLLEINRLCNLTEFLIFEAVKIEKKLTLELSNAHKTLRTSLNDANNLVEKIKKIMPNGDELRTKETARINFLYKKLTNLKYKWKKALEKLSKLIEGYCVEKTKKSMLEMLTEIRKIEKKELIFATDLQILTEKINKIEDLAYNSYTDNDTIDRDTATFNEKVPLEVMNILKEIEELLATIEEDFRFRMEYDSLSFNPPYGRNSYPKGCISNEEYVNKFTGFLSKVYEHIQSIEDKTPTLKEGEETLRKKRQEIFGKLKGAMDSLKDNQLEGVSCVKYFREKINGSRDTKYLASLINLAKCVAEFISKIYSDAISNKNNELLLDSLMTIACKAKELLTAIVKEVFYQTKSNPEHESNIEDLKNALKEADKIVNALDELLQTLELKKENDKKLKDERLGYVDNLRVSFNEMKKYHGPQCEKLIPIFTRILEMGNDDKSLIKSVSDIEEFTNTLYLECKRYPIDRGDILPFLSHINKLSFGMYNLSLYIKNSLKFRKNVVKSISDKDLTEFDKKIEKIENLYYQVQNLSNEKIKALAVRGALEGNPDEILKEARMQQAEEDLETMLEEEEPEEENLGDTSKKK